MILKFLFNQKVHSYHFTQIILIILLIHLILFYSHDKLVYFHLNFFLNLLHVYFLIYIHLSIFFIKLKVKFYLNLGKLFLYDI